jgi:hypothetical protein
VPLVYEERHTGSAIVLGGAPCVHEDLAAARKLRPDAVLLGANLIGALFQEIRMVWTQHPEDAATIRDTADVLVHSRPQKGKDCSGVDYLWPDLTWVGGTSGMAAALWARHGLGYSDVVMAGSPLLPNINTYVPGYPWPSPKGWAPYAAFGQWHDQIRSLRHRGLTAGITSMSGATRKILGAPEAAHGIG